MDGSRNGLDALRLRSELTTGFALFHRHDLPQIAFDPSRHQSRCLKHDFPRVRVKEPDPERNEAPFTLSTVLTSQLLSLAGNVLKKLLEAIKDLVSDGNFDCNDTGISLQAMVGS